MAHRVDIWSHECKRHNKWYYNMIGYNSLAHELHLHIKQQVMEVKLQEDFLAIFGHK
jgi:hypothetical protein